MLACTLTSSSGLKLYQTVWSFPKQSGSSAAVVASSVLILSLKGRLGITVALSKSSLLGGCANAPVVSIAGAIRISATMVLIFVDE